MKTAPRPLFRIMFPLLVVAATHLAYRDYEKSHTFTLDLFWQILILVLSLYVSLTAWLPAPKKH